MNGFVQRLLTTIILSLLLVMFLSFIPKLQAQIDEPAVSVFSAQDPSVVWGSFVDEAVRHQKIEIQKIDWVQQTLFLEIKQPLGLTEAKLHEECYLLFKSYFALPFVKSISLTIHTQHSRSFQIKGNRSQLASDPEMENRNHLPFQAYLQELFTWTWLEH